LLEQLANGDLSLLTYLIILAGGLVSGLSPCALPTVLLIVGYVGGRENVSRLRGFYLSLAFVLGISLCLSILGMTASLAGGLFLGNRFIWYAVAVITIAMGLSMLGLLNFNLSTWPAWMKIRRKHAARCKKSIFCHHDFNSHFRYLGENRLNRSAFTMRFTRSSGPW